MKKRFRLHIQSIRFLEMIKRIHLPCGSFGSIICFWIKIPDLDFREETHPKSVYLLTFWGHDPIQTIILYSDFLREQRMVTDSVEGFILHKIFQVYPSLY